MCDSSMRDFGPNSMQLTDYSDQNQPQFKLDIRNAPIHEEDGDAETALANVASTLRAVGHGP